MVVAEQTAGRADLGAGQSEAGRGGVGQIVCDDILSDLILKTDIPSLAATAL